jgi:tetratricopeptide (TPR) repeat protein
MRLPTQQMIEARNAFVAGDFHTSAKLLRVMHRQSPNDAAIAFQLGVCESQLGRLTEARKLVDQAVKENPRVPEYYCVLAGISRREGKIARSEREVEKALSVDPKHVGAIKLKAELRFFADDAEGACRVIDEAVARGLRSHNLEIAFGLFCASTGRAKEGIERLVEMDKTEKNIHPQMRATGLFRLAALYDKTKQFDLAWETYVRANELRKPKFNPVMIKASIEQLMLSWRPDVIARMPRAVRSGERLVFVVGMPRSGTSLVEQIIASHPKAYGAGELVDLILIANMLGLSDFPGSGHVHNPERLSQFAVDDAAKQYHATIQSLAPGASRVTDKNPFNIQHVGLIHTLFPGARVVWCRRNPIDVCVSNYFQDFQDTVPFAFNLEHIAMMYRMGEKLMRHWQTLFPGLIMELHYDDLVDHQEQKTRELLEFCGLSWDERCLRFYESDRVTVTASNDQVRKPLYKSTGRYAPYEKHLVKLRQDLGLPPAGLG